MIIDNKNISDKDIERINSWSRNKLTRDDIYAFEIALCSDKIDVDYEMISEDCLYRLQRLAIGSTGILSQKHNARIYDTYFTVLTNPNFDSSQNGEDYNLNKPITKLIAKAFIRKDHIKREELESILSNAQGSIGFSVQKRTCSICGETDCFRHIKGKYYKTESCEKLCYLILDSPTDFYEWSICPQREENENDNEQPKGDKQMGVKTQLKINGELKDVEIENGEVTIIEPEKKATGWERGELNKFYYRIDKCFYPDNNDTFDNQFYKSANYFSSKELAENISRMQTLQRKMFRWQAENDVPDICRKNDVTKYYFTFYTPLNRIEINSTQYYYHGFLPVFSSKEKAEECIEAFKGELAWLFTEFQWRMDGEK